MQTNFVSDWESPRQLFLLAAEDWLLVPQTRSQNLAKERGKVRYDLLFVSYRTSVSHFSGL